MDTSTTLVTFIVHTPPSVNSVTLLGSWDNFTTQYSMESDICKGMWRGCHRFKNIICDGELDPTKETRDGGLKMGGKYWYYYQLDGDVEYCNQREPCTTSCPLLPGQPVNILDVPMEMGSHPSYTYEDSPTTVVSPTSIQWTMDPADKFQTPRPAFTPPQTHLDSPSISNISHPSTPTASLRTKSGIVSPLSLASSKSRSSRPSPSASPSKDSKDRKRSLPLRFLSLRDAFSHSRRTPPEAVDADAPPLPRNILGRRRHEKSKSLDIEVKRPKLFGRTENHKQASPLPANRTVVSPAKSSPHRPSIPETRSSGWTKPPDKSYSSPNRLVITSGPRCKSADDAAERNRQRRTGMLSTLASQDPNDTALITPVRPFTAPSYGFPAEVEEDDDDDDDEEFDYNFKAAVDGALDEDTLLKGLSPPPSRKEVSAPVLPLIEDVASIPATSYSEGRLVESNFDDESPLSHFSTASASAEDLSLARSRSSFSSRDPLSRASLCFDEPNVDSRTYRNASSASHNSEAGFLPLSDDEDSRDRHTNGPPLIRPRKRISLPRGDADNSSKRMGIFFPVSGFHGYSLPEDQYASEATLRKTATPRLVAQDEDSSATHAFEANQTLEDDNLSESPLWDRQVQQDILAMEELHDDLRYLGGIIA
ncbi:MAG: hypothetical protein M4579_006890 [Chaenotheca gracillima]|nr:MAG: hypothetical protein M4579_006890 [Chaenotheca gracillima]